MEFLLIITSKFYGVNPPLPFFSLGHSKQILLDNENIFLSVSSEVLDLTSNNQPDPNPYT